MVGKVWKTGNSYVVTIDKATRKRAGLEVGDIVQIIAVGDGQIVLRKATFAFTSDRAEEEYGGQKSGKE